MRISFLLFLLAACSTLPASAVTIKTSTLPNGTVATAYSATVLAVWGFTPYTWTVTGALPPGVGFTVASDTKSLSLSGTPSTAGSYTFVVQVMGYYKSISKVSYMVTIQPEPNHVVDLNWTASTSSDVAGYNMYRGPDGVNWQKINIAGLIASTLYSDSTVANGTTYYYAATAVDLSGVESPKSVAVEVAVP